MTICIVCCGGPVFTLVVFCSPLPLGMVIFWIWISTQLLAVNFRPRPLYPVADSRTHVQHMTAGVREPSLYKTVCQGERCDPICVRYTRDQLLAISPARLTPDLTYRLRKLDIGFVYHVSALAVVVRI